MNFTGDCGPYGRREIIVRAEGFDLSLPSEQQALKWRLDLLRERWRELWPGVVACLHAAVQEHEAEEASPSADPEDVVLLSSKEQSLLAKAEKLMESIDDDDFVPEPLDVESILSKPETAFGIIICHFFEAKQRDLCWKFALDPDSDDNHGALVELSFIGTKLVAQTFDRGPD